MNAQLAEKGDHRQQAATPTQSFWPRTTNTQRGSLAGWATICVICACAICLWGCGSAGPYGFARTYSPLSGEEAAADGAREYDPIMAGRRFHEWVGEKVSIFGVVKHREKGTKGRTELVLSVRDLQRRNLCESQADDSCRVTVTEHEFATIIATVNLKTDDLQGKHSLSVGSLVRVIGKISNDTHKRTGNAVVVADFYRHWPRNFFVTTSSSRFMRQ